MLRKVKYYLFLENKIAKWWMPDDIIFVEELPHIPLQEKLEK